MQINSLQLSNSYKTLLLEDIFPKDLIDQILLLCEQSENSLSDWHYVEWSRLRKIYSGSGTTMQRIKEFLSTQNLLDQLKI